MSFSYDSYRGGGCTSLICGVFKGERNRMECFDFKESGITAR